MPGLRDRHSGCVGAYLWDHDLFDFLLLSLPDNDTHSHRNGPAAQVTSLAEADRQIERLMHAAGGPDAFLEEHAVVVCSDHSQSQVEAEIDLFEAFDGFDRAAAWMRGRSRSARSRCARRRARPRSTSSTATDEADLLRRVVRTAMALDGVDIVMHRTDQPGRRGRGQDPPAGSCAFGPAATSSTLRGQHWSLEGETAALELLRQIDDDVVFTSDTYPNALGRIWSSLRCRRSGSVLLSAAPGYEFTDWGGSVHPLGGGSHGSLHANDSHGVLLWAAAPESCPPPDSKPQWTLLDPVTPMILDHFQAAA